MLNLFALPAFNHVRVIVWYQTPAVRNAGFGTLNLSEVEGGDFIPTMGLTHKAVCHFYIDEHKSPTILDYTFQWMQGENWSPNGEANDHIRSLDLRHTSMSVGDIVQVEDRFYCCEPIGWCEITDKVVITDEQRLNLLEGFYQKKEHSSCP